MRTKGFACPSLASIFRPSVAAPTDPAVLDVAQAIYIGGRSDGVPGLEAVAHVIQNRCRHPAFPSEPQAVVLAGSDQFVDARHGNRGPVTSAEKQLYNQATRLASQLLQQPQRLPFPDPTTGAIYYDQRAPTSLHSAVRPCGTAGRSAASTSSGAGSSSTASPAASSSQSQRGAARAESADPPSEDDVGAVEPPRASPQKSRRPLSFFRDRGATGISQAAAPPQGGRGAAQSAGAPPLQPVPQPGRVSLGGAPAGPSFAALASSPPPRPGAGVSAPPGAAARPLGRPMLPGRGGPAGLAPQHPLTGLHRGPAEDDGYHDMILPCGLFQEQVIEIMYRDLKPEDFDTLNKLDERVPKRNIAQRNLVDRLPRCLAADCGCSECGVCLAELSPGARVVQLPCRHAFHPACISRWLTQCKASCPLCSAPIAAAPPEGAARAREVARSHEAAAAALAGPSRSV